MFYCDECRKKKEWPESFARSHGACEICGTVASCNDTPSKYLPLPKPPTPNPMLEIPFSREGLIHKMRKDEFEYILREEFRPIFFTMGSGNAFPGGVICIWAPDREAARVHMVRLFGERWCTDYDLDAMVKYVQKWDPYLVGEYVV